MPVTASTLRTLARLRIILDNRVDTVTADLAQAWSRGWTEIADEFRDAIDDLIRTGAGDWPTPGQIRRAERAAKALQVAAEKVGDLSTHAGVTISGVVPQIVEDAAESVSRILSAQLPAPDMVSFNRVDPDALEQIVKRTMQQVTSTLRPLSAESEQVMRSVLIRGVAVGDNPRTAAAEMLRRTRGAFTGGAWRAQNIARTELLDSSRASALLGRQANADVVRGWKWLAELSRRTCPACLSMNGTIHPATDPGPEGHPSCRCTSVPISKSWRDLGFDIDEPDDEFPDAQAWFEQQGADVQTQIMGKARLSAYRSGDLSWDRMAVRRENPDWRPSWQTRPVG